MKAGCTANVAGFLGGAHASPRVMFGDPAERCFQRGAGNAREDASSVRQVKCCWLIAGF